MDAKTIPALAAFETQEAFVQRLRQAIGDPGSITIRRGMTRDGKESGEPFETVTRWQVGTAVRVIRDRIDSLRDTDPPIGSESLDAFLDGWNAALDALDEDLRAADERSAR